MCKYPLLLSSILAMLILNVATAQENTALFKDSGWTAHFQLTIISQNHSGFHSKYSGMNSLADSVELNATSITSTAFIGRKLWRGATAYINPELSGGKGLSYAVGVAGALNGETYRIGDPAPVLSVARAYIQQYFDLSGGRQRVGDDVNQVSDSIPQKRLTITAGKFSMSDFFDRNSYSHDPRTQFLNWGLMSNGAWDYPANTKGYTIGVIAELAEPGWTIRASSVEVPKIANHPEMEYQFGKAHSETLEFEKTIAIAKRPGSVRLLLSYTASRAPSYADGIKAVSNNDTSLLNVISGNAENDRFGGKKAGIFLNAEQEIAENIGVFARAGWNDGKYVTWAFTEIDQTIQLGLSFKGAKWKRNDDVAGIAAVVNGLSSDHRSFLTAGGYGFIIGDGQLNYGHEAIVEAYYSAKIFNYFWLTGDYQFVNHPAYNKDRGPVHVFAVRGHVAF